MVERPRVLYNELTQRFVMWMHIDTGDYELARCGMATSPSATGKHAEESIVRDQKCDILCGFLARMSCSSRCSEQ